MGAEPERGKFFSNRCKLNCVNYLRVKRSPLAGRAKAAHRLEKDFYGNRNT